MSVYIVKIKPDKKVEPISRERIKQAYKNVSPLILRGRRRAQAQNIAH